MCCPVGGHPRPRRHAHHPRPDARPGVHPHAAGLDIGREESWAGVPEDRDAHPVRPFGTLPPALWARAAWLASGRIETGALASTGVYGSPVDDILEAWGGRVHLVHVRQTRPHIGPRGHGPSDRAPRLSPAHPSAS